MCGIYKITNLLNNKCYIGQALNITKRFWRHKHYKTYYEKDWDKKILYRAFEKYGIENFSFEIIEECLPGELNNREQYWIQYYDTYYSGYNGTFGGDGALNCPVKLSEKQIFEIYNLLKNSDISQNEIAKKYNVGKDVISTINHGKSRWHPNTEYPIRKNHKGPYYCPECGVQVSESNRRCINCAHKKQYVVEHPNRETLKELIRNTSFVQIGKMYNVTDNTIRKWCIKENLPSRAKDIKQISDADWINI